MTTYYRVDRYQPESEPAVVAVGRAGFRPGLARGWHPAGEYALQEDAEKHGRAIVAEGYEARVQRVEYAEAHRG